MLAHSHERTPLLGLDRTQTFVLPSPCTLRWIRHRTISPHSVSYPSSSFHHVRYTRSFRAHSRHYFRWYSWRSVFLQVHPSCPYTRKLSPLRIRLRNGILPMNAIDLEALGTVIFQLRTRIMSYLRLHHSLVRSSKLLQTVLAGLLKGIIR